MDEQNPYAPPDEAAQRQAPTAAARPDDDRIRAALARLDQHLADPANVAADRKLLGGRLRRLTWTALALTLALAGGAAAGLALGDQGGNILAGICGVLGGIFLISFVVALVNDLRLTPRESATTPAAAAEGWLRAMRLGRAGYVFAGLCPSGRESTTAAPDLRPVVTPDADYALATVAGIARWLKSFARPGTGQVRWMKVKSVRVLSEDGDVASVEARIFFRSWPNWANITSIVLFLFIRIIGLIIALVLWYTQRKQITVDVEKVVIRGRDGLWYVLDGEFTTTLAERRRPRPRAG